MKKNSAGILLAALVSACALAACNVGGNLDQPAPTPNNKPLPTRIGDNLDGRNIGPGGITADENRGGTQLLEQGRGVPAPEAPDPARDDQLEDTILYQLGKVADIQDVEVQVNGNRALVAYTPTSNARDTRSLHAAITEKVKQIDGSITEVRTSPSQDVRKAIRSLKRDRDANLSPAALTDRFNRLFSQITQP